MIPPAGRYDRRVFRRLAVLAALVLALVPVALARAAPPAVDAAAYALVNPATDEVLASKAPDRQLPMASTTKIMTALVTLENAKLTDRITVPPAAVAVGGSSGMLEAGETLTVRQLLTALLVPSGNDAAVTLARGVAGSQGAFVALMNQTAQRLGLTETHYANPHGLDAPGHHSSAGDMVALGREAMRNPVFRAIVSSRRAGIPGPDGVGVRRYLSENELLDIDPEADGIKTGMTDGAGFALVAHARRPALGVELYVAIIGAPSSDVRALDAKSLLDYGFSQYASADLVEAGTVFGRVPVEDRPGREVPYRAAQDLRAPIRIGQPVTETIAAPTQVSAPVAEGARIGTVTLRQGAHVLGTRPLVAAESAGEPGLLDRLRAGLGSLVP